MLQNKLHVMCCTFHRFLMDPVVAQSKGLKQYYSWINLKIVIVTNLNKVLMLTLPTIKLHQPLSTTTSRQAVNTTIIISIHNKNWTSWFCIDNNNNNNNNKNKNPNRLWRAYSPCKDVGTGISVRKWKNRAEQRRNGAKCALTWLRSASGMGWGVEDWELKKRETWFMAST